MAYNKHKSILIAFISTMVRFYDYSLFGLSAGVISKKFMPFMTHEDQLLGFFVLFSLAMLMRPLGSVIFGSIGDKSGRVAAVKIATLLAALSTLIIGFIPGYDEIGVYAPLCLLLARVLFLFSLAGEIDGIKIYVTEMVGPSRRCFAISLVTFASQIGVLVAAITYHHVTTNANEDLLWRWSFIFGGILGFCVFLIRKRLVESELFIITRMKVESGRGATDHQNVISKLLTQPAFCSNVVENSKLQENGAQDSNGSVLDIYMDPRPNHTQQRASEVGLCIKSNQDRQIRTQDENIFCGMNLFGLIKYHKVKFIIATVISGFLGGMYNFLIIFLSTFSAKVAGVISVTDASFLNVELVAIYALASVISGLVADRINYYQQVYIALIVGLSITILALFTAYNGSYLVIYHKMIVLSVPFFVIPTYVKLQSLFATTVRMRMFSLSHSLGSMLFSAPIPVFAMLLWKMTNLFFMVLLVFALQVLVIAMAICLMRQQS